MEFGNLSEWMIVVFVIVGAGWSIAQVAFKYVVGSNTTAVKAAEQIAHVDEQMDLMISSFKEFRSESRNSDSKLHTRIDKFEDEMTKLKVNVGFIKGKINGEL